MHRPSYLTLAFLLTTCSFAIPTSSSGRSTLGLQRRETGPCSGKMGDEATKEFGDFTGCTSSYADGAGNYVRSGDEHHYGSGDKCWTDLYLVDVDGNAVSEWYKVRGQDCLDCNGTSECTIKKDESVSLCTSVTFSQEVSIGFDAVKSAISASMSVSTAYTEQQCNSTTMGIECKWDDDLQHSVWAQNQLTRIYGYTRRRCNFKKDDKGDVTVWSKDYIIDTPNGSVNTGCSALCEATQYPA